MFKKHICFVYISDSSQAPLLDGKQVIEGDPNVSMTHTRQVDKGYYAYWGREEGGMQK